jgi:hypothetical protein
MPPVVTLRQRMGGDVRPCSVPWDLSNFSFWWAESPLRQGPPSLSSVFPSTESVSDRSQYLAFSKSSKIMYQKKTLCDKLSAAENSNPTPIGVAAS